MAYARPKRVGWAVTAARAAKGKAFARPVVLDGGSGLYPACGCWRCDDRNRLDVAGAGRIRCRRERARRRRIRAASAAGGSDYHPAGPQRKRREQCELAEPPAVSASGDVLLAYSYGPFSAVHTVVRPAWSTSFGRPRLHSTLGYGGAPIAAFLSSGDPLVAFSDGAAIFASTRGGATGAPAARAGR